MGKNIVVCLDGTSNQFGAENSNVVKLYSVLKKDSTRQLTYYDPGVGTLGDRRLVTPLSKKLSRLFGLAFGYGVADNISEAYSYLMENYQEGDNVFLFGFSRGALTVRALAGMLHACGLLAPGNENMVPYAYQEYLRSGPDQGRMAARYKATYSRECKPHFLGVWDTVTSVGWAYRRRTFPFSMNNPDPKVVRHAISIDERRAYYPQNLFGESYKEQQDVKQVWFVGVHSDVGGSYPEKDSGLSKLTLEWMLAQAAEQGLLLDGGKCRRVVQGVGGTEADGGPFASPDCAAKLHPSLHGGWWILEYLPMNRPLHPFRFSLHRGRRRGMKDGCNIHRSVLDRMASPQIVERFKEKYQPPNLPQSYGIEEYKTLDCDAIQPDGDARQAVRQALSVAA
ncbi:MAG TPA: DUF2235 domain-containing protein [Thermoanaerobaculia bacterium]